MCDHARPHRIRNEVIRQKAGITPIEDQMKKRRLTWFGHIKRRYINAPIQSCERIDLPEFKRDIGRQKESWNKVIR